MATFLNGILGGFSGKVGTVIGSSWKGIDYMRSRASHISQPNSPAQLEHRAKFSTVGHFLRPLNGFLRICFQNEAVKMSAYNAAMAYNLKNAITGAYPDYTVDYTRVAVSRGILPGVLNGAAASSVAGKVDFTWDDNTMGTNTLGTDKVVLLVYNPLRNQAVWLIGGRIRAEGTDSVTVPNLFSGETVECYIGFTNPEESVFSDSQWVGSVEVA